MRQLYKKIFSVFCCICICLNASHTFVSAEKSEYETVWETDFENVTDDDIKQMFNADSLSISVAKIDGNHVLYFDGNNGELQLIPDSYLNSDYLAFEYRFKPAGDMPNSDIMRIISSNTMVAGLFEYNQGLGGFLHRPGGLQRLNKTVDNSKWTRVKVELKNIGSSDNAQKKFIYTAWTCNDDGSETQLFTTGEQRLFQPDACDVSSIKIAPKGKMYIDCFKVIKEKVEQKSDEQKVSEDAENLTVDKLTGEPVNRICNSLSLPDSGVVWGSSITWESDNEEVIAKDGTVVRPQDENVQVTLTAFIQSGDAFTKKSFAFTVLCIYDDYMTDEIIAPPYLVFSEDMEDADLDRISSIFNSDSMPSLNLATVDGNNVLEVTEANADSVLQLSFDPSLTGKKLVVEYTFKPVNSMPASDLMLVQSTDGKRAVQLEYNGQFFYRSLSAGSGSAVGLQTSVNPDDWTKLHLEIDDVSGSSVFNYSAVSISDNGTEQTLFSIEDKKFLETAASDFSIFQIKPKGKMYIDNIKVWSSDTEEVDREKYGFLNDRMWLSAPLLTDEKPYEITKDLFLPEEGVFGSTIKWTSSNPNVIDPESGAVNRQLDNTDVKLTAHLTWDDGTIAEKDFLFLVRKDESTDQEAVDSSYESLEIPNNGAIVSDFELPENGISFAEVTWSIDPESNSAITLQNGTAVVHRGNEDVSLVLSAVIKRGSVTRKREFPITVLKQGAEKSLSLIYEDFDSISVIPADWKVLCGSAEIQDGNLIVKGSGTSSGKVSVEIPQTDKRLVFQTEIKVNSESDSADIFNIGSENYTVLALNAEDGNLKATIGKKQFVLSEDICGKWLDLQILTDQKKQTVTVFCNGIKKGTVQSASMLNNLKEISYMTGEGSDAVTAADYLYLYPDPNEAIEKSLAMLNLNHIDTNQVTEDFFLPSNGVDGAIISWESSNTSVITIDNNTASVHRPPSDTSDAEVVLTARISNGFVTRETEFRLRVLRLKTNAEIVADDLAAISLPATVDTSDTTNIELPAAGANGSVITWTSDNESAISSDGTVFSSDRIDGDGDKVRLTAFAVSGSEKSSRSFDITVIYSDMAESGYVTASTAESGNSASSATDGKADTAWQSSKTDKEPWIKIDLIKKKKFNKLIIREDGNEVKQAKVEYSDNDLVWTLLTVIDGGGDQTLDFDMTEARYLRYTVIKKGLDPVRISEISILRNDTMKSYLEQASRGLVIENLNNVTKSFTLPILDDASIKLTWTSDNPVVCNIKNNNAIISPRDKAVWLTITAVLEKGGESVSKQFRLKVIGTGSESSSGGGSGGGSVGGKSSAGGFAGVASYPQKTEETSSQVQNFIDVPNHHWANNYISALFRAGVVKGKGDRVFAPEDNVTREEFIKMLAEGMGVPLSDAEETNFVDVSADAWYAPYIYAALQAGIIRGIDDTHFGVTKSISREDMAVMVCRMLNYKGKKLTEKYQMKNFSDLGEISEYALSAVEDMVKSGVITGDENGAFRPKDTLTRAEAAKVLYMIMNL